MAYQHPGSGAPGYPAPGPGYPAAGQGYPTTAPPTGQPAPGQRLPATAPPPTAQGYQPTAYPGYPAPGQGYQTTAPPPAPGQAYPAMQQGYPTPGYPAPGQGYPAPGQAQLPQQYPYPAPGQGQPPPGYPAHAPGQPAPGVPGYSQPPASCTGYQQPPSHSYPAPGMQGYPAQGMPPQPYAAGQPAGGPVQGPPNAYVLVTVNLDFNVCEPLDSRDNAKRKKILNDVIRSKKPTIICTQDCPANFLNDSNLQNSYVQELKDAPLPGKFIYNWKYVTIVREPGQKGAQELIREELGEESNGLFAELFRFNQPNDGIIYELVVVNWNGDWNGDQRGSSDKRKKDELEELFNAIYSLKKHDRFRKVPICIGGNFALNRSKWFGHPDLTYWDYMPAGKANKKIYDMLVTSKDVTFGNVQSLNLRTEERDLIPHDVVYGKIENIVSPLPFHESHGMNITLDLNNEIATRETKKGKRAYVFSERPLRPGEVFMVQLLNYDKKLKGNLHYGLTSLDPNGLKEVDFPEGEEVFEEEDWVADSLEHAVEDDEVTIHLSRSGRVNLQIGSFRDFGPDDASGEDVDPDTSWWAFFNVMGKTVEIRSIGSYLVNEDEERRAEEEEDEDYTDDSEDDY